jgi:hypothetical protein
MAAKLVLIADQDEKRLIKLQLSIADCECSVLAATNATECLALKQLFRPNLVVVEAGMVHCDRIIQGILGRPLETEVADIIRCADGQSARYFVLGVKQKSHQAVLLKPGASWPQFFETHRTGSLKAGRARRRLSARRRSQSTRPTNRLAATNYRSST